MPFATAINVFFIYLDLVLVMYHTYIMKINYTPNKQVFYIIQRLNATVLITNSLMFQN